MISLDKIEAKISEVTAKPVEIEVLLLLTFYKYISRFGHELGFKVSEDLQFIQLKNSTEIRKINLVGKIEEIFHTNPLFKNFTFGISWAQTTLFELMVQEEYHTWINFLMDIDDKTKQNIFYNDEQKENLKRIFNYLFHKDPLRYSTRHNQYPTNESIGELIAEMFSERIQKNKNLTIYDPAIGIGKLLIPFIKKWQVAVMGQDISSEAVTLSVMYLIINGASKIDIRLGDVLLNPLHTDHNKLDQFDLIVSEPPFRQFYTKELGTDYFKRWNQHTGIPEKTNTTPAFILHMLASLKKDGVGAVIIPNSFLNSSDRSEKNVREHLINKGYIKGIIKLPSRLVYHHSLGVSILIFSKIKENDIFMIDASNLFEAGGILNELTVEHIHEIATTWKERKEVKDFSVSVKYKQIKENYYKLYPSRYFPVIHEDDIPKGFELIKLKDIISLIKGEKHKDGVGALLRLGDLSDSPFDIVLKTETIQHIPLKGNTFKLTHPALIIPRLIMDKGLRIGFFKPKNENDFIYISNNFYVLRVSSYLVDIPYLANQLLSEFVAKQVRQLVDGSIMQQMRIADFLNIQILIPYGNDGNPSLEKQHTIMEGVHFQYDKDQIEKLQLQNTIDRLLKERMIDFQWQLHALRNNELALVVRKINILKMVAERYTEWGRVKIKELDNQLVKDFIELLDENVKTLSESIGNLFTYSDGNVDRKKIQLFTFIREYIDNQNIINLEAGMVDYFTETSYTEKSSPVIMFNEHDLNRILENILENIKRHSHIEKFEPKNNFIQVYYDFTIPGKVSFSIRNKGKYIDIKEDDFFSSGGKSGSSANTGKGGYFLRILAESNEAEAFINTNNPQSGLEYVFEVGLRTNLISDEDEI